VLFSRTPASSSISAASRHAEICAMAVPCTLMARHGFFGCDLPGRPLPLPVDKPDEPGCYDQRQDADQDPRVAA
jgi:hypothetical protein